MDGRSVIVNELQRALPSTILVSEITTGISKVQYRDSV